MADQLSSAVRRLLARRGPEPQPEPASDPILTGASDADRAIVERAFPYSMTGYARLLAVVDAVRYCVAREVRGAFVECGVWRGGSVLAMILTLQSLDAEPRDIWLFDTFEGMTAPTERDASRFEPPIADTWREAQALGERPWNKLFGTHLFTENLVRQTLLDTGYPKARLHLVKGPVEETVPDRGPDGPLALLRLDTDWYESTRHELEHMYPQLQTGGVLIIDDYGHFEGAREAVDEYFASRETLLLSRIDYTGRMAIKA